MTHEQLLSRLVSEWALKTLPHQSVAAERAAAVAVRAYTNGASVGEACFLAREFLESWARHPSNRREAMAGRSAA